MSSAIVRRRLDTKDENMLGYKEDRSFYGEKLAVIFAWSSHLFVYHGSNRGNVEISFLSTETNFIAPAGSDCHLITNCDSIIFKFIVNSAVLLLRMHLYIHLQIPMTTFMGGFHQDT